MNKYDNKEKYRYTFKTKKKEEEIIWTYQVQACTKITVNSVWLF